MKLQNDSTLKKQSYCSSSQSSYLALNFKGKELRIEEYKTSRLGSRVG